MITELETLFSPPLQTNEHYPGLAGLSYARRWLDGFLSIVEGYLMTFSTVLITVGISFSMFDFLTGGTALDNPTVYGWWAAIQTIAIDAQFINMWYRAKCAIRDRRYWQASGYIALGVTLAFVAFGASVIPAIQKGLGMSFTAAIAQTGISPLSLIMARSMVAIMLGVIGAFQRSVVSVDHIDTRPATRVNWLQNLREKWAKKQVVALPSIAELTPAPEAKSNELYAQHAEEIATDIEENTLELAANIEAFFAEPSPEPPAIIAAKITRKLAEEPQEKAQFRAPSGQTRYTPQEAVKLAICQQYGVKVSHIKTAINRGELRANLNGKISKSAVEKWVKSRRADAA